MTIRSSISGPKVLSQAFRMEKQIDVAETAQRVGLEANLYSEPCVVFSAPTDSATQKELLKTLAKAYRGEGLKVAYQGDKIVIS